MYVVSLQPLMSLMLLRLPQAEANEPEPGADDWGS